MEFYVLLYFQKKIFSKQFALLFPIKILLVKNTKKNQHRREY